MIAWFLRTRIKTILTTVIVLTAIYVFFLWEFVIEEIDESKYRTILWWTPFLYEDKKFITCEKKYTCVVTKNRSFQQSTSAFLFYGSNFDKYDLPLPKYEVPWAIFHEESPKNLAFFLNKEGQQLFNITATFSRNSDLPLTLQYLEDLNSLTDNRYYLSTREKNTLLDDIAPVLYIQSDCDTPIQRDLYVSELMNYVKIDSYGKCLHNKDLPEELSFQNTLEDLYDPSFMKFISRYKFTIAIENAVCKDYITEKLWRPLMAGSIPIYLGSPTVQDWLPNLSSAILISEYQNMSDLASYIIKTNSNDSLYEEYMDHKILRKISNHRLKHAFLQGSYGIKNNVDFTIPAFECFVCKAIHEELNRKVAESVYNCEQPRITNPTDKNWWIAHWESGKCEAKVLHYFIEVLKISNYTKEMFERKYEELLQNNDC